MKRIKVALLTASVAAITLFPFATHASACDSENPCDIQPIDVLCVIKRNC